MYSLCIVIDGFGGLNYGGGEKLIILSYLFIICVVDAVFITLYLHSYLCVPALYLTSLCSHLCKIKYIHNATNNMLPNIPLIYIGLAVDRENGWICHLSYTHKVAVAWEGRSRVPRARLMEEYTGKRALSPSERKKRLKPLNDLFSMAECCLMADTVQYFLDRDIPFCPRSAVNDVLGSITGTHISGEFHKMVAREPEKYFEDKPYLKDVLDNMMESGKRLIFVRYVCLYAAIDLGER